MARVHVLDVLVLQLKLGKVAAQFADKSTSGQQYRDSLLSQ